MEIGIILAMIMTIGELLKKQGLHPQIIPWINTAIGIFANLFLNGVNLENAGYGFILGLIASGLYDNTKIYTLFKKSYYHK